MILKFKRLNRKGIQNHIVVLFVFSFFVSFFLIFIMGGIFRSENPACKLVDFDVINACKTQNGYAVTIVNNNQNKKLDFLFNGDESGKFIIPVESKKTFQFKKTDDLEFTPFIRNGFDIDECGGKVNSVDVKTIIGACK